jgi:hypothetical protein
MNFSNLIDAIVFVLDLINSPSLGLMSSSAFATPIPFVGMNIGQAVSFADKIAHVLQQIDQSPVASLQRFTQQFRSLLGLPATSPMVNLTFVGTATQLETVTLSFRYSIGVTASSNLYFDLASMVAAAPGNPSCTMLLHCTYHN